MASMTSRMNISSDNVVSNKENRNNNKASSNMIAPMELPSAVTVHRILNTGNISSIFNSPMNVNQRDTSQLSSFAHNGLQVIRVDALWDSNSSYTAVTSTCLALNQFATFGSSSTYCNVTADSYFLPPSLLNTRSVLRHDSQYLSMITSTLLALSQCAMQHSDRRSRLIALRTVPSIALAGLANFYGPTFDSSDLDHYSTTPRGADHGDAVDVQLALFTSREQVTIRRRLEDEICHEVVASTLLPLALQEEDEIISICALEVLATIIHGGIHATTNERYCFQMYRNIQSMCNPSISLSAGIDSSVLFMNSSSSSSASSSQSLMRLTSPLHILARRIVDVTLIPNMKQILHRISLLKTTVHQIQYPAIMNTTSSSQLSTLTSLLITPTLVHMIQTDYIRRCQREHSKASYAKRVNELDSRAIARDYVQGILLPLLQVKAFHSFSQVPMNGTFFDGTSGDKSGQQNTAPTLLKQHNENGGNGTESNITDTKPTVSSSSIHRMMSLMNTSLVNGVDFPAVTSALELCAAFSSPKEPWADQLVRAALAHLLSSSAIKKLYRRDFPHRATISGKGVQILSPSYRDITRSVLIDDRGTTLKKWIALILFSLRGVSLEEKLFPLSLVSKLLLLRALPSLEVLSTAVQEEGHVSMDLVLYNGTTVRPIRAAYWVDIALSLLTPGVSLRSSTLGAKISMGRSATNMSPSMEVERGALVSKYLSYVLDYVCIVRNDDNKGSDVIDAALELVISFCSVSCILFEWNSHHYKNNQERNIDLSPERRSWILCAFSLLTKLSFCLRWHREESNQLGSSDDDVKRRDVSGGVVNLTITAQAMYLRLFRIVLQSSGYLHPSFSVCLRVEASGDDTLSVPVTSGYYSTHTNRSIISRMTLLLDDVLSRFSSADNYLWTINTHLRISFIAIITDAWTQHIRKRLEATVQSSEVKLKESQAKTILYLIRAEILIFLKNEGCEIIHDNLFTACVSCVENIALVASEWADQSVRSKIGVEDPETLQVILLACLQTLTIEGDHKGISKPFGSTKTMNAPLFRAKCSEVADRIRALIDKSVERTSNGKWPNQDINGFHLAPYQNSTTNEVASFPKADSSRSSGDMLIKDCIVTIRRILSHTEGSRKNQDKNVGKFDLLHDYDSKSVILSYDDGYLVQFYRQVILDRCIYHLCAASSDSVSGNSSNSVGKNEITDASSIVPPRPYDPFRVCFPRLHAQSPSNFDGSTKVSLWSDSVVTVSGLSDPMHVTLAYAPQRCPTVDGGCEWKLAVTVKIYNVTPVPIRNGIRLVMRVLPIGVGAFQEWSDCATWNVTSVYKQEIASGHHLTWEVLFGTWPLDKRDVQLFVTYRDMEMESSSQKWTRMAVSNCISTTVAENDGDDGKSTNGHDEEVTEDNMDYEEDVMDLTLSCATVSVSPLVTLRPSPLVFFRCDHGDQAAFRFLWFSLQQYVSSWDVGMTQMNDTVASMSHELDDGFTRDAPCLLAKASSLAVAVDGIGGDPSCKAWAFKTWKGHHILCVFRVYSEKKDDTSSRGSLQIRSDNKESIESWIGKVEVKTELVSSLLGNAWVCL